MKVRIWIESYEETIEIPDSDLRGLDEKSRDRVVSDWASEHMQQVNRWGHDTVEDYVPEPKKRSRKP